MKNNTKKTTVLVILVVVFCIFMAIIDGIFKADYFVKSVIKLVMFLVLPSLYSFFDKDNTFVFSLTIASISSDLIDNNFGYCFNISINLNMNS